MLDYWQAMPRVCKEAMAAAKERPGLHGGRFIAIVDEEFGRPVLHILPGDDAHCIKYDRNLQVLAHAFPDKVVPLGQAKVWLRADGTIRFEAPAARQRGAAAR